MSAPAPPDHTPMMAQYHALKAKAEGSLLFYRMGDFFELFFDDARVAAACLDIALTSRGTSGGAPVPMCGVPVHAADAYLARLIRAGHRVAIAEQVETPAAARARGGAKALVRRAIVRHVTAGTLTEDALLDGRSANRLVAVVEVAGAGRVGIAAADISTGRCELLAAAPGDVDRELARLAPSEIVAPAGTPLAARLDPARVVAAPAASFASDDAAARAAAAFGGDAGMWLADLGRAELAALAGLLAYIAHTSCGAPLLLVPPEPRAPAHMGIDAATRASLELTRTQQGARAGSLLAAIDAAVTAPGARQLADDLSAPLTDAAAINARLDLVAWLAADARLRADVRVILRALPDPARAMGRLVAGRGGPRDLAQLGAALNAAAALNDRLAGAAAASPPALLAELLPALVGHGALTDELSRALIADPPVDGAGGGYIADGYDAALDALRAAARDGRAAIAALEAEYRGQTGIGALKIRHNAVLGYHIEVPARHADPLMAADSGFTHRQTMAGAVRFNAPALHDQASRVVAAAGHALAAEAAHLEALTAQATAQRGAVAATAAALARLDVAAALAEQAMLRGWCRPVLEPGGSGAPVLAITAGRHPVVEAALAASGGAFVPNDLALAENDRIWLVSGPNMGGKSTFLRQNALIVVMAQAGSFVPAAAARIGVVDQLFSRVGASDNLARGQSTFMVEMVETAAILAGATPASFVILDEVGRGTSTYDGLALAWAVAEAIHDGPRCRCLFATHFHELGRLAGRLDALSLHHVRAREWQGDLVLLHEVGPGMADRSYGLAVARLAGVPPPVVARAEAVLAALEAGRASANGAAAPAAPEAGLDDLPLFAAEAPPAPPPDPLRAALGEVAPDHLSPRAALDLIYRLKALAAGPAGPRETGRVEGLR